MHLKAKKTSITCKASQTKPKNSLTHAVFTLFLCFPLFKRLFAFFFKRFVQRSAISIIFISCPSLWTFNLLLNVFTRSSLWQDSTAAVLILLYPNNDKTYFYLTKRADTVKYHKGQISLPGGSKEKNETLNNSRLTSLSFCLSFPFFVFSLFKNSFLSLFLSFFLSFCFFPLI